MAEEVPDVHQEWWEYLDQIWDAAAAAERVSLPVLPALMRARKEQQAAS